MCLWVGVCVRGGYIIWGWLGVLEGCECFGRRGRRETTQSYDICYIYIVHLFMKNSIPSA